MVGKDETIVHTQHNGTFKAVDAPEKLKKLVDYMVANNIAEISNWDNYDAWDGKVVRFDGLDSVKTAEIVAKLFGSMAVEKENKVVVDVKIDDMKIYANVSKEAYDMATKVAA